MDSSRKSSISEQILQLPFPPLPVELVRTILETAAKSSRPTALSLSLVSSSVREWILPTIFGSLALQSHEIANLPTLTPHITRNISVGIRRLFLFVDSSCSSLAELASSIATAISFLSGCPNLESLITDIPLSHEAFQATISWPTPWQILLLSQHLHTWNTWGPEGPPLLRKTTHLSIDHVGELFVEKFCIPSCVTHLALGCNGEEVEGQRYAAKIQDILDSAPTLTRLLVTASKQDGSEVLTENIWKELAIIEDHRLLVRPRVTGVEWFRIIECAGTLWDGADIEFKDWRQLCKATPRETNSF
ncbi:hypothetical protein K439DRAFT_1617833 [Ramaria rubella]|nr:hypothetical protein K439DRAFT_1617833 [Ramaria rubella]